ncbi:hypothetical protein [Nocardioides taihuensis]|uniref:Uncharacterized protein n=1 Tax=Nocardioides taihuensis TaxID=1835606 RepID=A0ABW0BIW6_9ACTN
MSFRRRVVSVLVLVLVGSGGFVAAQALAPTVEQPGPVERVHRYYGAGPSAVYDGDSGGIGQVSPLQFQAPGAASRAGVVEASFSYRTRGPGPFVVSVRVGEVGGERVTVKPGELPLARAPHGGSTTVRFLAPELVDGTTYEAYLGVNSVFAGPRATNAVHTRHVVLTVDLH